MSNSECGTKSVILYYRTTMFPAHSTQFRKTQGITIFTRKSWIPANVFSENIKIFWLFTIFLFNGYLSNTFYWWILIQTYLVNSSATSNTPFPSEYFVLDVSCISSWFCQRQKAFNISDADIRSLFLGAKDSSSFKMINLTTAIWIRFPKLGCLYIIDTWNVIKLLDHKYKAMQKNLYFWVNTNYVCFKVLC